MLSLRPLDITEPLSATLLRPCKHHTNIHMIRILKKLNELIITDGDIPTKKGEVSFSRDYLLKPDINPYLVYTILKENFGQPNSDIFDEDKSQWQWLFTYKDFHIEIYDWRLFSSSIAIYHQSSDKEQSQKLAETINDLFNKAAQQKKAKIKLLVKEAKHKLLENPFVTYYSTAENLLELSTAIDQWTLSNSASLQDELSKGIGPALTSSLDLWDKKSDLYRSAFLMFLSSFEGFLNIMYELYLKTELRADRLYDRISREQVDVKLRIAPIYCDGFKTKTINHEDDRFKNYLRLVNLRNDYVHANLIKSLERYIIEEDNHTFILENEDTSDIPSNINELELKHVELAKKYIDDIVELVFESMETKTKREFKSIIFESEIEVEDEDGVLIPKH